MLVPKLRFKEFSNIYIEANLKDISIIIKDGTHGTHQDVSVGIPLLSAKDIYDNKIHICRDARIISINDYNSIFKNYNLQKGDILMTIVGSIGRTAIYNNEKIAFQRSVATIRINENNNSEYIRQYLESNKVGNQLKKMTNSSAQGGIYLSSLEKIKIFFPLKDEQKKIANTLELLDRKIELQTKKIAALKLYKKGLILDLMKKKNEWLEYKVKDIFNLTRGIVIPKTGLSEECCGEYKYPVYSSQTSNEGILGFDNKYDFDGKYLTWTTDGANAGKVFFRNGKFRTTNVCGLLYEDNIKHTNELVAELLNYVTPKHVSYVGNPKLMNNVMGEIKINLPNEEIQLSVSKIINLFNKKISKEDSILVKMQKFKKGLIQNMFV